MKLEIKFTPGPWKAAGLSQSGNPHYKVTGSQLGGKFKVARAPFHPTRGHAGLEAMDKLEAKANAQLIAAAPTMFEYLQRCMYDYIPGSPARASIQKLLIQITTLDAEV